MTKIKYGKWTGTPYCKHCHERLTHRELMYSSGICPHCGFNSKSTIVGHYYRIFRTVKHISGPWYWRKVTTEIEVKT